MAICRVLVCILFLLTFLSAAVDAQPANSGISTTFLAGCEIDYPPFCMVHADGRADGFSVELMRQAFARMGHEVAFKTGTWTQVRDFMERGEIQALPLVGRTPEREDLYDFSVPYLTMYGAVVVRADNTDIKDFSDLRGRRVGVMQGDNAEEFLRRSERGIDIFTEPTFTAAFNKLADGDYDAVVIQRLVALRLLEETGIKNLKVINKPIYEFRQEFCFAVGKGDSKTLAILNEGLALLLADGTFRHLHARWFASLEIPSARRIIVGGDANYPPYDFVDENGQPAGLAVDVTRAVARAAGLEVDTRLGYWPETIHDLEAGKIDAVMGMLYSPERDLKFDFSAPHIVCEYVIAYHRGIVDPPRDLKDIEGRKVIVVASDIMHEMLLARKNASSLIVADNFAEAFTLLRQEAGAVVLTPRLAAMYFFDKMHIDDIELTKKSVYTTEYCFAVANGNKALLAKFSEGLKAIEASGEYRQIQEKWLGVYGIPDKQYSVILRHLATVTLPLVAILLLVFAWSWTLRRQVARKTIELQESEACFRSLVEGAATGIWVQHEDKIIYLNDQACRLFGAGDHSELMGRRIFDNLSDSSREEFAAGIASLTADRKAPAAIEFALLRLDGSIVPVEATLAPIKYLGKNCVLVFVNDISRRKEAEAEIDRLTAAVEQVGEVIIITDTNAIIQYANPALEIMTGYSRAEVIGQKTSIFKSGQHNQKYYEDLWRTISSGQTWTGQMVNRCKNGVLIVEEATISPVFEGDRIISYVAVKHDVTETMSLNEQLQQARKMEAIGQLAGGVAHDYNNMVGVILGYAEMAKDEVPKDMPLLQEYLAEIYKAARRSAEITSQLLAFARKQTIAPIVLDLNDTVSGMLKMLSRLLGESIEVSWVPGPGLLKVKMDPTQINQILANLCVNARDAVGGGGKIAIETAEVSFDEAFCETHSGFRPGDYVLLAVSDNGCGIAKDLLDKIFEPFFTTKKVGKGTGLGLATVFGIVKQNDGFINVYSEPGKGTTFKIYIPRDNSESVATLKPRSAERPGGLGEKLLVVEDDPAIRRLVSQVLTKAGYQVMLACAVYDAINFADDQQQKIDLLITDVIMPVMNGSELYERLRLARPDLRCLYMSGYTANVIAQHGVLKGGINFLAKPFSNTELLAAVREALS
jgi:PAS domain S-box-containing protein